MRPAQVHAQAKAALRAGMEMLSQAEVGAALQIYYNLDALPQVGAISAGDAGVLDARPYVMGVSYLTCCMQHRSPAPQYACRQWRSWWMAM